MNTFRILTIAALTSAVFSSSTLPVLAKATSHATSHAVTAPKAAIKPQPLPPKTPPRAQIKPQPLPPVTSRNSSRY